MTSMFDHAVEWLSERYGDVIGPWLARRLAKVIRDIDDPCMNNFRVCDLSISDEVTKYEESVSRGCCGSVDKDLHHYPSDRRFRVGFNYGH